MSREIVEALAWALIHFTWQGALVALAAGLTCATLRSSRPQARYVVLVAALGVMAVTPVATTAYLLWPSEAVPAASVTAATPLVEAVDPVVAAVPSLPAASGSNWLLTLVACWAGIAAFLSLRSFGGWLRVQRLAHRSVRPVARAIERKAAELGERLGLSRAVRVVLSSAVEVPGVVGWLKPVVLLPLSVATMLTPEQIEQILAHELAHVRRHDYLVNLFQAAVENVLFYHPAVWWISGQVRAERENCCDDLAVATCGDATSYARTLAQLETMRGAAPALLPAASGGSLLARVRRLLGQGASRPTTPGWVGLVVPIAIVALALVSVPSPEAETETPPPSPGAAPVAAPLPPAEPPAEVPQPPAPTASATPDVVATPAPRSKPSPGYLAGLYDAGFTDISVEDIITLRNHGVGPAYVKAMLGAGLGRLTVEQVVRLHDNGVRPEFAAAIVASGITAGLDVENVIRLFQNGVQPETMRGIRALGFGPYAAEDVLRLTHNGVDVESFRALQAVSGVSAPAEHAIQFRQNGVTTGTIREAERQGFKGLTYEQVLKLHRAGVI